MKVQGRYGTFTPRPDQAPIYAKRAKAQQQQQAQHARGLAEWLERHKACANGCGKPVAFYDAVNYALKHGGCCSAECETAHRERQESEQAARITAHAQELHGALELVLFTDRLVRQHKGRRTELYRDAVRENNQAVESARELLQRLHTSGVAPVEAPSIKPEPRKATLMLPVYVGNVKSGRIADAVSAALLDAGIEVDRIEVGMPHPDGVDLPDGGRDAGK